MDRCLSAISTHPLTRILHIWADSSFVQDVNTKIESWPRARCYVVDGDISVIDDLQKQAGYLVNCIHAEPVKAAQEIAGEGSSTPSFDLVYLGPSSAHVPSDVVLALTLLSASKIKKGTWIAFPASLESAVYDIAYAFRWVHRGNDNNITFYECSA